MVRKSLLMVGLAALPLTFLACSENKQSGANQKKADTKDDGDGDEGKGEGSGNGTSNGSGNNASFQPTEDDSKVFGLWCERAGETAPVQEKLGTYFKQFCNGSQPTALFTTKLIKTAYAGGDKVTLSSIEGLHSNAEDKTTIAYFAIALKLPISVRTHFEVVGPKGGDKDALIKLAEAQGATGDVEIVEKFEKDGKYHVRGWKVHATNEKVIKPPVKVVTETVNRSDQFELEKSKAYAYTQYVEESIKGIKQFDMLTAGVQVGGSGYLITVAKIVADNKGIPSVAESTIKSLAESTAKAMYKVAAEAKGQEVAEDDTAGGTGKEEKKPQANKPKPSSSNNDEE